MAGPQRTRQVRTLPFRAVRPPEECHGAPGRKGDSRCSYASAIRPVGARTRHSRSMPRWADPVTSRPHFSPSPDARQPAAPGSQPACHAILDGWPFALCTHRTARRHAPLATCAQMAARQAGTPPNAHIRRRGGTPLSPNAHKWRRAGGHPRPYAHKWRHASRHPLPYTHKSRHASRHSRPYAHIRRGGGHAPPPYAHIRWRQGTLRRPYARKWRHASGHPRPYVHIRRGGGHAPPPYVHIRRRQGTNSRHLCAYGDGTGTHSRPMCTYGEPAGCTSTMCA